MLNCGVRKYSPWHSVKCDKQCRLQQTAAYRTYGTRGIYFINFYCNCLMSFVLYSLLHTTLHIYTVLVLSCQWSSVLLWAVGIFQPIKSGFIYHPKV